MRRKISVRARVRLRRLIGRSRGRASLPARRDNVTSREVSWQGEKERMREGREPMALWRRRVAEAEENRKVTSKELRGDENYFSRGGSSAEFPPRGGAKDKFEKSWIAGKLLSFPFHSALSRVSTNILIAQLFVSSKEFADLTRRTVKEGPRNFLKNL